MAPRSRRRIGVGAPPRARTIAAPSERGLPGDADNLPYGTTRSSFDVE
jgi:hypothetical protein